MTVALTQKTRETAAGTRGLAFCLLGLLLLIPAAGRAQKPERPGLFHVVKDGRSGFINSQGRIAIPARFDDAADFHEGLARVSEGGKLGFINLAGEVVWRASFDSVGDFSEGLATVEVGWKTNPTIGLTTEMGQWGFVDKTGRLAIPLNFTRAGSFSEGLAAVQMGKSFGDLSGFIDHAGRVVFEFPFDVSWGFHEGLALVRSKDGTFFLDKTGKKLHTPQIDDYQARSFSEGLAAVQIAGKWGYIDKTGRIAITPQFDDAASFSEGLAAVRITVAETAFVTCPMQDPGSTRTSTKLYGYIDRAGRMVIPPQFEYAGLFSEGLAAISNCSKPSFIDKTGAIVLRVPFDEVSGFADGIAAVFRNGVDGTRVGYINRSGQIIWEPTR